MIAEPDWVAVSGIAMAMVAHEDGRWIATVSRHWIVDRPEPR